MSSQANKRKLSGSTDGMPIIVAATATPWTLIHTAVAGTTEGTYDEIWIYASNISASAVNLTLERGDADVTHNIKMSIPASEGEKLLIPWFILQNGKTVKAFAGTTNVINITGWVNAITDA